MAKNNDKYGYFIICQHVKNIMLYFFLSTCSESEIQKSFMFLFSKYWAIFNHNVLQQYAQFTVGFNILCGTYIWIYLFIKNNLIYFLSSFDVTHQKNNLWFNFF